MNTTKETQPNNTSSSPHQTRIITGETPYYYADLNALVELGRQANELEKKNQLQGTLPPGHFLG